MIKYTVEKDTDTPVDPFIEELALQQEKEDIEVEEATDTPEASTILDKLLEKTEN